MSTFLMSIIALLGWVALVVLILMFMKGANPNRDD